MNRGFKVFMVCSIIIASTMIYAGVWSLNEERGTPSDDDTIVTKGFIYDRDWIEVDFRKGDFEGFPDGIARMLGAEMTCKWYITPDDPAIVTLWSALEPALEGKTDYEKADLLLRFVQNNIIYESDEDSFDRYDYVQFPAETLYSEHGDCEDMAYLLYTLYDRAGLDAVLVRTTSHTSVGVNVDLTEGTYITMFLSDTRYYIAEATGSHAIGDTKIIGDLARAFKPAPYMGYLLIVLGVSLLVTFTPVYWDIIDGLRSKRKEVKDDAEGL